MTSADHLLGAVLDRVPPRRQARLRPPRPAPAPPPKRTARRRSKPSLLETLPREWGPTAEIAYRTRTPAAVDARAAGDRPYHPWEPAAVVVDGAAAHPTTLVQSAAMAAVRHPEPMTSPLLPTRLVSDGALSDAQLESVVLAAEAHGGHLDATFRISEDHELVRRVDGAGDIVDDDPGDETDAPSYGSPVRFRQGWMLGDGTGCGKGRQVAAIILDRWLRGQRRALWLSQSDKLIEDARRDWQAVGGLADDVIPLGRFRQKDRIPHAEGILFTTYATLRSPARNGNRARLDQIVEWLAGGETETERHGFDGVVVFDEAHAMANAAGGRGARGDIAPSQQGRAGMRLQNALPDARVLYVSATGASTIQGLGYAVRLGLWSTDRTPFEEREKFVQAMEAGGVAALEVVARDLKALGLYQARALSYTGVEIDILEHPITPAQREIYDTYAGAFKIIHAHLDEALEAVGITSFGETRNAQAKSAARSAFEGAKQRFFGHLLTSMKCPTLIRAIEADLSEGRSAVVQLVSTGEALTDRRLAEIPPAEWDDLSVDVTPREYVLDFLRHAFPTTLHEEYEDDDGNLRSRPVHDKDGNPVQSVEAVRLRDDLLRKLGLLPPVGSALDQVLHHFGDDAVAEITGRSRRILRVRDERGERHALRPRAASANTHETHAFMNGDKRVLVFSLAGNTGRSYHADLGAENTDRRVHYLLEPGWRADQAIQGLGRTHRTHQKSAPLFRPVTTDVKGERRFISTIARRLDSLGAITRGQRDSQTAMGEGDAALFRATDNFESPYAKTALRQFYMALYGGSIPKWSASRLHEETGLRIAKEDDGTLRDDLPPMHTFLNRLLALPIAEQNELFAELETRLEANVEAAIEAGRFNEGVERIKAKSLTAASRETAVVHAGAATDTELVEIVRRDAVTPLTSEAGPAGPRHADEARQAHRAGRQHAVEPPGRMRAGPGTDPRGRIRPEPRAPAAPARPREPAAGRHAPLELAQGRHRPLAAPVGRGDRGHPALEGVAPLARHRPAAARLAPPRRNRLEGLPPDHRRRREPDRPRADHAASDRAADRPRARRAQRPAPERAGGLRRGDAAPRHLPPRPRLAPARAPQHGRDADRDQGTRLRRPAGPHPPRVPVGDRLAPHRHLRPQRRGARAGHRALPRRQRHRVAAARRPQPCTTRRPAAPDAPRAPKPQEQYPCPRPDSTTA